MRYGIAMKIRKKIDILVPDFCCEGMKHSMVNKHFILDKKRNPYFKTKEGTVDEGIHIMDFCPYCGEKIEIKTSFSERISK